MRPPTLIKRHDRETAAEIEVGVTMFSRGGRALLIAGFLITILSIPLIQHIHESIPAIPGKINQPRNPNEGSGGLFGDSWNSIQATAPKTLFGTVAGMSKYLKGQFKEFEKSLEDHSFLRIRALPAIQEFFSNWLGQGNEKVLLGRDGWLFYKEDVDHLLGTGFLKEKGTGQSHAPGADPLPALIQFNKDLAGMGIHLLVLPIPVKPSIEAEHLGGFDPQDRYPLKNPSTDLFFKKLEESGIDYLDLTQAMHDAKASSGKDQFLKTDTHWTPDTMEMASSIVAGKIRSLDAVSSPPRIAPLSSGYVASSKRSTSNQGDLSVMLGLPAKEQSADQQQVQIHPVNDGSGKPWQPDTNSEILLLGDSFSRIYSAEDLRWGKAAGLAEHLSLNLQRPLDILAINGGGSSNSRRELARTPERLQYKKIVIYEFSMRALSSGDWPLVPIEKKPPASPDAPKGAEGTEISGIITEMTHPPDPGTSPYRDVVITLHLKDPVGLNAHDVLVFIQAIKNGSPTNARDLKTGQRISMKVRPWDKVESKYGAFNRIELQGPAAEINDIYWCDEIR